MSPVNSERSQAIQTYISQNPACKIYERWPMEFGGHIRYESVYEIPIRFLYYNLKNGRYAVELAGLQADEGYELDPTRPQDREKLRDLLLRLDVEQTETLQKDIQDRGQIYPGVITQDGFVINANRRMAILEKLHGDHPGGQYERLKVQILPVNVEKRDLWRLEAGLQLSRDTRVPYSPINELLKLREGQKAGLSAAEIAAAMYGRKSSWVEESLERLKIMEQYLEYIGKEQQYHRVEDSNEQFSELQKNQKALERDGFAAEEQYKWVIAQFQLIGANISNWDLRLIKKIARDDEATRRIEEEITEKSRPGSLLPQSDVVNAFEAAKATIESKEEADKPGLLLDRAIAALSAIRVDNPRLPTGHNKYLFKKLRNCIKQLESILGQ